jgi:hypothetical protein
MQFSVELFYLNVPGREDKLGFFKQYEYANFFDMFSDKPSFIWTGGGIENIDYGDMDFSNLKDIDFYLYEPSTFYHPQKQKNCQFYHEDLWKENNNLRSHELDCLQQLAKNKNLNIRVFTSDYNMYYKDVYPELELHCFDIFLRQVGIVGMGLDHEPPPKQHKFFCANKRFALHRAMIMNHLQNKSGRFSWHFNFTNNIEVEDFAWLEADKLTATFKQDWKKFRYRDYGIDLKGAVQLNSLDQCGQAIVPENVLSSKMPKAMAESCIAIVNETRYGQPTGYFSEKTFDPMRMCMPFIEVSSPHTLQYLKDLGFKTFHHFWDESYDEIENHTDRFIKICELITYLDELPDNELRAIAKWSHTITQWNREKVENFRKDRTILK